ncbi:MurR/RpiR family transcriptional regulator [Enterococcus raffinosus]|uniref:MurR/RpiR family transcriptional regulator n=1 Tax=Enterococcus raffinosus TaxID=71452 RepID=UPI001C0FE211|nr:MurR/RpiR family transcriptional regulator [Enterococcus raffinosus]MBU5362696.1 MurR/RpiR family transcriptional regulator [Enterococcus raffinosus]
MPIFAKIQEQQEAFSKSELKIAQFILDQPQDVLEMTAQQLARAADSSSAAVIRLCKRLKVYGFPQLKIELSADLSGGELSRKIQPEVRENEEISSIKERLLVNTQNSLAETVEEIDDDQIYQLSQIVARSRRLLVLGIGVSNLVAQDIAQKWGSVGTIVIAFNNVNDLLPIVANAGIEDSLWVVDNSGETPEAIYAAQIAKERKVPIITMTKKGSNTISELGDVEIHTSQPIELPGRIAATDSLLLQFMAIDIIFYDFVSRNYESSISQLNQSAKLVKDYKNHFYKNK